jgi:hypothetical protein
MLAGEYHTPYTQNWKSRFPACNVWHLNEAVATDTICSNIPAVDNGVKAAQLFIGCTSVVADVYGVKTDKELLTPWRIKSVSGELWISLSATVLALRPVLVPGISFGHWLSLTGKVSHIMKTRTLPRIVMPHLKLLPTVSSTNLEVPLIAGSLQSNMFVMFSNSWQALH